MNWLLKIRTNLPETKDHGHTRGLQRKLRVSLREERSRAPPVRIIMPQDTGRADKITKNLQTDTTPIPAACAGLCPGDDKIFQAGAGLPRCTVTIRKLTVSVENSSGVVTVHDPRSTTGRGRAAFCRSADTNTRAVKAVGGIAGLCP